MLFLAYPLCVNPFFAPTFGMSKLTFLRLLTGFIAIIWLVKISFEGKVELARSPLYLAVGFFVLINTVATGNSVHVLTSLFGEYSRWEGLLTLLCYCILSLAALNFVRGRKDQWRLITALLISASLVSLAAIIEHFGFNLFLVGSRTYCAAGFGQPNLFEVDRAFATFGNPIYLGMFLGMVFPLATACFLRHEHTEYSKPVLTMLVISLVLIGAVLFFTFARGAWLGTGLACAIVMLLSLRLLWHKKMVILAFAAILLIGYAFTLLPSKNTTYEVASRAASTFKLEGSNIPRVEMWKATLPMIADRPLLGSGPDTFKLAFPKYKPAQWVTTFQDPQIDRAHNELLQIAATTGLLGVTGFLWLVIAMFFAGMRRFFKIRQRNGKVIILGLLAAAFSFLVQVEFNPNSLSVAPIFWAIIGLIFNASTSFEESSLYCLKTPSLLRSQVAKKAIFVAIGVLGVLFLIGCLQLYIADVYFSGALDAQHEGLMDQAESCFERASRLNSSEELYSCSLGRLYADRAFSEGFDQAYFDSCADLFSRSIRINPIDENVFFHAGDAYLQAGRVTKTNDYFNKSIKLFRKGLRLNATSSEAYLKIGVAYACVDRNSKALWSWRQALGVCPQNSPAYYNLGLIYEEEGATAKSERAYKNALRYDPKSKEVKQALRRIQKTRNNDENELINP